MSARGGTQRLTRFEWQGRTHHGRVRDTSGGEVVEVLGDDPLLLPAQPTGQSVAVGEVRLLAPVKPGKIIAVGLNYADHTTEMGLESPPAPRLFFKPPSAVIGPGEEIRYPAQSNEVHHEAELAVVIGRKACNVRAAEALSYVFGYTCANDVTARDIQRADGQPSWAKAFDTFCPIGPWVVTGLDPAQLEVRCLVNQKERQRAATATMLYPVAALLEYVSAALTLEPGDVLLTGTPSGVGPILPGDEVTVEITRIGTLVNPVSR
ncbi:fumarylacetoacetate hydrolase family protein [Streptomyces sp. B1866]|uniref:fumarylacetoacetate hydrolase family protein n=1 Tax=Streptomyces sp. B1866 TaxID=3075431 RepID=UPI002890A0D8|nr:fumarylacetoacetate hydrolase family protein [Streptomyces sp. B1866]MDT3397219.1 fumarylacetoacetate hydrolase family protein [Streptomyces sp. B1866]